MQSSCSKALPSHPLTLRSFSKASKFKASNKTSTRLAIPICKLLIKARNQAETSSTPFKAVIPSAVKLRSKVNSSPLSWLRRSNLSSKCRSIERLHRQISDRARPLTTRWYVHKRALTSRSGRSRLETQAPKSNVKKAS